MLCQLLNNDEDEKSNLDFPPSSLSTVMELGHFLVKLRKLRNIKYSDCISESISMFSSSIIYDELTRWMHKSSDE